MKFPYRPYRVRLYHGEPYTTVWRPTAQVILHGPLGSVRLNALFDPGADQTMLPRQFADALGIAVDDERPGSVRGVGGSPVIVHPGEADLELVGPPEFFRWRAAIRFGPGNHALLGQLGALEFFTATFDYYRRYFELVPNERYPGSKS
jgi:hypothetical protein